MLKDNERFLYTRNVQVPCTQTHTHINVEYIHTLNISAKRLWANDDNVRVILTFIKLVRKANALELKIKILGTEIDIL